MYKIVGADKKEYGPVSAEQLRDWIRQGRSNGQTIASFEGGPWKPLSTFPEFASEMLPPLASVPPSAYGQPARANTLAVTGLVFSILGLFCCGLLGAIIGIVCSAIGLSQIKDNPGKFTTKKSIPIAGIIIGVIGLILFGVLYSTGVIDQVLEDFRKSTR